MKYANIFDDCYNLYTITTTKFLSGSLEIVFVSDLTKEALTYLNLLRYVLLDSTKSIKSNKELLRTLEFLYNTKINMTTTRVGKVLLTSIKANFLNQIKDEELENIVKILFDIINNPNTSYNSFDEEIVKKCKRKVANEILSIQDDLSSKSLIKSLKMIDDIRGLNIYGDIDILNEITEKKLLNFYKSFIEESFKNIYYMGTKSEKEIKKLIQSYQKFNSIQTKKYNLFLDDEIYKLKPKIIKEPSKSEEIKVVQIYSFNVLNDYEKNYVMPLINTILGAGSQDSLIFKKIREIEGLVYNLDTFYQKYDSLIILNTMCDEKNSKKILRIIKECLDNLKKGDFSEESLNDAKKLLLTSYNIIYDDKEKLIENYIFNTLFGDHSIEEKMDYIRKVNKKDIVNTAKKIKLIITYLGGNDGKD